MAMSAAERQRRRRAKLKQESMTSLMVRGENGEFDERIRVALAVKDLAQNGELPEEVIKRISSRAEIVFPNNDLATRKYINKIVTEFLK